MHNTCRTPEQPAKHALNRENASFKIDTLRELLTCAGLLKWQRNLALSAIEPGPPGAGSGVLPLIPARRRASEASQSRSSRFSWHPTRADSTVKNSEQAALTGNGPTCVSRDTQALLDPRLRIITGVDETHQLVRSAKSWIKPARKAPAASACSCTATSQQIGLSRARRRAVPRSQQTSVRDTHPGPPAHHPSAANPTSRPRRALRRARKPCGKHRLRGTKRPQKTGSAECAAARAVCANTRSSPRDWCACPLSRTPKDGLEGAAREAQAR